MKRWISLGFLFALIGCTFLPAQMPFQSQAKAIQPDTTFDNVLVKRIFGDDKASGFVIWIKQRVPAHFHAAHSETVMILEGKAEMTLGDQRLSIKKGDIFFIPKGTAHSVTVKKGILKVLSIQAPEFEGTDRVMVKEN